jgi:F-type H+-transporting ATPase subunit gamma
MSETMTALKRQIDTTRDLQSVVKTMRALAAVNIRQYQEAVTALEAYRETIELGLQIILQRTSTDIQLEGETGTQKAVAVIIGSDQGLVGQFNRQIVNFAHQRLDSDVTYICAVGLRLIPNLDDLGYDADATLSVPGDRNGITPTVREMLLHIENWRQEHDITRLALFFNRPTGQASYEPQQLTLLPLDSDWLHELSQRPWETRSIPISRVDWLPLFRQIIQQHLFASLYFAIASSLASENASRLAAMESARDNIEGRLDDLQKRFNQQRQQSITEELFDIVAGFDILQGE